MKTNTIKFVHNNKIICIENANPNETLLNYIRTKLKKKSAKEGCGSGDCGACSVVIAEKKKNNIIFDTIDTIQGKNNIYGYDPNKIDRKIIKNFPSALKIAEVAYKNYDNSICHDIKSIKPNYIKPIQFKKNIS